MPSRNVKATPEEWVELEKYSLSYLDNPLYKYHTPDSKYVVLTVTATAFIAANMALKSIPGSVTDQVAIFVAKRWPKIIRIEDFKVRRSEEIFCCKEIRFAQIIDHLRDEGFAAELQYPWCIDWLRQHSGRYEDGAPLTEKTWLHRKGYVVSYMTKLREHLKRWKAEKDLDFPTRLAQLRMEYTNSVPFGLYNMIHEEFGKFVGEQYIQIKDNLNTSTVMKEFPYY